MQTKLFLGAVMVAGALAAATLGAVPTKRSAVVKFVRPTIVAGTFVMGTVVFEHDDEKMARGGPCTTVYEYDAKTNDRGRPIVAFMCLPRDRPLATKFEATLVQTVSWPDRLLEYQIAGEREGHGVPDRR